MNVWESIADRRIREGRAAGLFDDLPGHGKPLPDLHRERPAGWWAARAVRHERSKLWAERVDDLVAATMPLVWRAGDEAEVEALVGEVNAEIADYNRVTTWDRREPLDLEATVSQWWHYRHHPPVGRCSGGGRPVPG